MNKHPKGQAPKTTPDVERMIVERAAAGMSLREIAAWLSTSLGLEMSHVTVRKALERAAARGEGVDELRAAAEGKVPAPKRGAKAGGTSGTGGAPASDPVPSGGMTGLMRKVLDDAVADLAELRQNDGTPAQVATMTRLVADMASRVQAAEPPPPAPEVDAEQLAAGGRAATRLRRLVDDEVQRILAGEAP